MEKSKYKYIFKCTLLGSQGTGKTSLVERFLNNTFKGEATPTVGAAFSSKRIMIDNLDMRLDIWDTAGQERFESLVPIYMKGTCFFLVVYDVTDPMTYEKAKIWIDKIRSDEIIPKYEMERPLILLIGNKIDLGYEPMLLETVKSDFENVEDVRIITCSAMTGENSEEISLEIMKEIKIVLSNENGFTEEKIEIINVDNENYPSIGQNCKCG
jgi:small GTP-binding protein